MRETVHSLASAFRDMVDNVVYVDRMDSTHALCLRLIDQMDAEDAELRPTIIIAGVQSQGLGRGERTWESPAGGLYLNWILSSLEQEAIAQLPMLAAVAAHRALLKIGVEESRIKWPNDIVVAGKKLAGILIHARSGPVSWATVGFGVNLYVTPDVGSGATMPATAVAEYLTPEPFDRCCTLIVGEFVTWLTRSLQASGEALEWWHRHLTHRPGDRISVRLASGKTEVGSFSGLTEEGYLRLDQDGAERIISSGDVIETG